MHVSGVARSEGGYNILEGVGANFVDQDEQEESISISLNESLRRQSSRSTSL